MVFSDDASGGPFVGTPQRTGCRPGNSDAREGAHTGAAAYQLVKRVPPAARASMFGVFRSVPPQHPRSWHPRSSARKITTLGLFLRVAPVCPAAFTAAAPTINSRLDNMPDMVAHVLPSKFYS